MDKGIRLNTLAWFSIVWACLLVLGGCVGDEPMPEIVDDYPVNRVVVPPPKPTPPKPIEPDNLSVPRDWVPPSHLERRWTAIIVHHSGTENGSAAIFNKWHSEARHWVGVGYHFVIGNGTDSGDGEVEVTFRWREQLTGAHCKTPENWANKEGIGICLVGDFNRGVPTGRQMQSLVKVVRFLQKHCGISKSRIYGHKSTPGAGPTDCPGRNFSVARLKSMLGS